MLDQVHPGLIFFFVGSTANLAMIWPGRRWQVVLLWLMYHAMLALAFIQPTLITPGIGYRHGYLVPGPTLAAMLALLAIEAAAIAAIRLGGLGVCGGREATATRTAIACFCVFVAECVLAVAAMAHLDIGMY